MNLTNDQIRAIVKIITTLQKHIAWDDTLSLGTKNELMNELSLAIGLISGESENEKCKPGI